MSKNRRNKDNNMGNIFFPAGIKTDSDFNAGLLLPKKKKKEEVSIVYAEKNITEDIKAKEREFQKREQKMRELERVFKNPRVNKIDISFPKEPQLAPKKEIIKKAEITPKKKIKKIIKLIKPEPKIEKKAAPKIEPEEKKNKTITNLPNKINSLISIKGADVKYNLGKDSEYHALKNVDLDIYEGEFIIFFGPSGCGKSTLVNVIAGLEKPCRGDVYVDGEDILRYNYDQLADYHTIKIGLVFQAYNLIDSLSIADNIALPQMFLEENRRKTKKLTDELLERFEIAKHAKKSPMMLSGGQQQRAGIARALINNPKIILADEPIGNLDSVSAETVVKIFKSLSEVENKTVILVTHNPDLLPIADRIFHIKDGCLVREEINEDKRPEEAKKKKLVNDDDIDLPAELKLLMRTYGNLTKDQLGIMWTPLKAKMITRKILEKYSPEQTEFIERAVRMRLTEVYDKRAFYEILDMPFAKGGAGLDRRSAMNVTVQVEKILEEVKKVKDYSKVNEGEEFELEEKRIVVELRQQLMRLYHGHLLQENVDMLDAVIRKRLQNQIDKSQFTKMVSDPTSEGGAGFNRRTAKIFSNELELLMLIKFGEDGK